MDNEYELRYLPLERNGTHRFSEIFSTLTCSGASIPCVDGIRYIPYSEYYAPAECYIKNNGIVEACLSLDKHLRKESEKYPDGFLSWGWLWNKISDICYNYIKTFTTINTGERVFICLSIVGCRNVVTEDKEFSFDYMGRIDRDEVICDPIEIIKLNDEIEMDHVLKELHIAFLLAIGVKYDDSLKHLIDEVYGNE
ncbi:MAG: hypothetical protein IJH60_01550 [Eubacterium sp.]|nr:hypothetical protein [Eubacterium sp.]